MGDSDVTRVGITVGTGRRLNPPYIAAVEAAGAEAVVLPPDADPVATAAGIDGLLLSGGPDVDPALYGEAPDPNLGEVDAPRDRFELALIAEVERRGLPVLAICRGHQVLNVAHGGKLVQHVPEHDRHADGPRSSIHHHVRLDPDTHLGTLVEALELPVNSLHHQVVLEPARGLRAAGWSDAGDGVVEAMESPDGRVLSVQCHPEELVAEHAWARRLFARFVELAASAPKTS